MYTYVGLKRVETEVANCGDIIAITGLEGINIGETVADPLNPEKIPFVDIDELNKYQEPYFQIGVTDILFASGAVTLSSIGKGKD